MKYFLLSALLVGLAAANSSDESNFDIVSSKLRSMHKMDNRDQRPDYGLEDYYKPVPVYEQYEDYGYKDKDFDKDYPYENEDKGYKCYAPSFAIEVDQLILKKEDYPLCGIKAPEESEWPCPEEIQLKAEVEMCSGRPLLLQTTINSDISINVGVTQDILFENLFADFLYEAEAGAVIVLKELSADCEGEFLTLPLEDVDVISRAHILSNEMLMDDYYDSDSNPSYREPLQYPYPPPAYMPYDKYQKMSDPTSMISFFQQYQDSATLTHVFNATNQMETVCTFTWDFEILLSASATCNEEVTTEDKAFASSRIEDVNIVVTVSG